MLGYVSGLESTRIRRASSLPQGALTSWLDTYFGISKHVVQIWDRVVLGLGSGWTRKMTPQRYTNSPYSMYSYGVP